MYIIFEGIDTCGKSTQIELFRQKNRDIVITKEPGGTDFGLHVREILLNSALKLSKKAEMMLFLADRAEHFSQIIKPNREKLILSDRGFISGMAYALSSDESLDFEFLYKLNCFVLDGVLPSKIVFFKMDKATLKSRLNAKEHDAIEKRGIEYLLLVQDKMEEIIGKIGINTLTLEASAPKESLREEIERFIL